MEWRLAKVPAGEGRLIMWDLSKQGVELRRTEAGIETNVPVQVVHHSPTGFEWGYGGSGPADLALNIVEAYLKSLGYTGPKINCWKGECFHLSWILHQDFKWRFIATMDIAGGFISAEAVIAWINTHEHPL